MTPPGTGKLASGSQLSVFLYVCPKQHMQNLAFFFFVVHENLTSQNPDSLLVWTYSRSFFSPLVQYGRWERASFTNNIWMLLFNDSESFVSWRNFFFFWRLLNKKNWEWNLLVVRRVFFFFLFLVGRLFSGHIYKAGLKINLGEMIDTDFHNSRPCSASRPLAGRDGRGESQNRGSQGLQPWGPPSLVPDDFLCSINMKFLEFWVSDGISSDLLKCTCHILPW